MKLQRLKLHYHALLINSILAFTAFFLSLEMVKKEGKRGLMVLFMLVNGIFLAIFPDVFIGLFHTNLRDLPLWLLGINIRFLPILLVVCLFFYLVKYGSDSLIVPFNLMIASQIIFFGLMLYGLTYTSHPNKGLLFIFRFSYYHLFACILPFFFSKNFKALRNIGFGYGAGSIIVGLASIFAFKAKYLETIATYREIIPIDERSIGAGVVFSFWLILRGKSFRYLNLLSSLFFVLMMFALILQGRRGVVFSTILALCVCIIFSQKFKIKKIIALIVIGLVFASGLKLVSQKISDKYISITSYTDFYSSPQHRIRSYKHDLEKIKMSLWLGYGTSADAVSPREDYLTHYTHNIFLEIAYQFGITGVVIFLVFLITIAVSSFTTFKSNRTDLKELGVLFLSWFIVFFIPAQFSFNLIGNYNLWFFAGLIGALKACSRQLE